LGNIEDSQLASNLFVRLWRLRILERIVLSAWLLFLTLLILVLLLLVLLFFKLLHQLHQFAESTFSVPTSIHEARYSPLVQLRLIGFQIIKFLSSDDLLTGYQSSFPLLNFALRFQGFFKHYLVRSFILAEILVLLAQLSSQALC